MKTLPISGTLLLPYLVYTAFVPVSIPHSIILLSLAVLTGFELFLRYQQHPSLHKLLEQSLQEQTKKLEAYDARILELKQELSRMSLERVNSASASSKPKTPIQF